MAVGPLVLLVGAGPVQAGQALEATGGGAALVVEGREARLEIGGGAVRIPWPERALASAVQSTVDGWLVAGTRSADGQAPGLFFLAVAEGLARPLDAPAPAARGARQMSPVPFVDQGRLVGAVWLEGERDDALGVRAAVWSAGRFRRPSWVSPPRAGSQLAPSGAVLADGSWLLVWTAFDGRDDEVMWSRRAGSSWLPPARVDRDDSWPDITPALAPVAGLGADGALLAWSGYDGETYRTVTAQFAGNAWRLPAAAGGAGSLYPAFRGEAGRLHLLYLDALRGAWEVIQFDAQGRPLRRAAAPALAGDETPLLEPGEREVVLRWPGRANVARGAWRKAP
jgi:hypothetical protein